MKDEEDFQGFGGIPSPILIIKDDEEFQKDAKQSREQIQSIYDAAKNDLVYTEMRRQQLQKEMAKLQAELDQVEKTIKELKNKEKEK